MTDIQFYPFQLDAIHSLVTAYLRSAYVTLNVDPLDAEYAQAVAEEEAPF